MIKIVFDNKENKQLFESDVRALTGAFFVNEAITIQTQQPVSFWGMGESVFDDDDDDIAADGAALAETEISLEFLRLASGENEDLVDGDITVAITSGTIIRTAPVLFEEKENTNHAVRRCLKYLLYDVLHSLTGKALPWGSLTGVRPTALATKLLKKGTMTVEQAREYYQREYYVSDEKTNLAFNVALRQQSLLEGKEGGYSLYIGVPFCPTTCLYCSFTSYPIGQCRALVPDYLAAVERELCAAAELYKERQPDTIYVGGGTPSSLEAAEIDRLLGAAGRYFDLNSIPEITFEAGRPDSITEEKLRVLRSYGISRISINPQTMNDATLKLIGRHHDSEMVKRAFEMARGLGFDDINMDIILGLPGERDEEVEHTLKEIYKLSPESLTMHSLAIKRGSRLNECLIEKKLNPADYHITENMIAMCREYVERMDMKPYYLYRQKKITDNFENVGYAKEGKYCLYNVVTMEEAQNIIACGTGTVSKRVYGDGHIERCDNVKEAAMYIEKLDEMLERKRQLFEH